MGPSGLFDGSTIPILEQVVNFSQARHNVLAGNIANLDTPGYRVRDLPPELFQARLREALAERDHSPAAVGLASTADPAMRDPLSAVGASLAGIVRHDDSNVSIEHQVAELAKNQLQHNLALAIMANQFRLLQSAISERA
jgi:flagellar basal-body rod protein FlgB